MVDVCPSVFVIADRYRIRLTSVRRDGGVISGRSDFSGEKAGMFVDPVAS